MSIRATAGKIDLTFDPAQLLSLIDSRQAIVGVIGMGYVGQPLAIAAHASGFRVIGFDIDPSRIEALNRGETNLRSIPNERIAAMRQDGRFRASGDLSELTVADVIVICVPTPLTKFREPDLSYVEGTVRSIAKALRAGQLISLESTTYPGTTRDVVKPILEAGGLVGGRDFYLAFSPEREDPGNKSYHAGNTPKVVGADDRASQALAERFYGAFVSRIVSVSSTATAEAVKLTENIFRCVNIALVNELKHIYEHMGVNVWDVIDAAATKPFGFMPFYPGPGLGGHCIPVDPFYLSWKAREFDVPTRFIELAGEINTAEPRQVVARLGQELAARKRLALNGARVLLMGLAYKKNVSDLRESPALTIFEHLEGLGAKVEFYDPWVPQVPETREHASLTNRRSIAWRPETFASDFDAALIVTDHDGVDYVGLVSALDLVVDTRNATRGVVGRDDRVVLA